MSILTDLRLLSCLMAMSSRSVSNPWHFLNCDHASAPHWARLVSDLRLRRDGRSFLRDISVDGLLRIVSVRMHANEADIDEELVRRLVAGQFPAWADLPIEAVASSGTDNAMYRLGADPAVRLPRTRLRRTMSPPEQKQVLELHRTCRSWCRRRSRAAGPRPTGSCSVSRSTGPTSSQH
ncbi:hypothetical protein [Amycolatopsis acidicola]|uniref:hypothetical protein n=1 Tax=Amycolatopsis acidicola TaxID=2596893 RepID=UPI001AA0551C|nr:hypothetical protein [Amycolatopsis acidicola]